MLSRQITLTSTVIQVDEASVGASYDIPLGNPALYLNELIEFMTISGTATLSNSLSITSSYTPTCPVMFVFVSMANINLNGNNITIFGTQLTQLQASNPFVVHATWNGTSWNSVLSRVEIPTTGIPNSSLANMPAQTVKANSGLAPGPAQDLTFQDFRDNLGFGYEVFHVPVSFNSGAVGSFNAIMAAMKGEIVRYGYVVTEDIENSDDASVEISVTTSWPNPSGSSVTCVIAAGTSQNAGTIVNTTGMGLDMTAAPLSNYITLSSTKVTWGGSALFSVVVKRSS